MRKNLLITLALAALPTLPMAQSYDNLATAEVLTGWRTDAGDHIAALRIDLKPGWVTYWRAPGDAGIPPQFQFNSDVAIDSITPHFPTPEVFGDYGMLSIGYYDNVVIPLIVDVGNATGAIAISGEVFLGVCEEVCIPMTLDFEAVLPAKGASDRVIVAALQDQPMSQAQGRVGRVTCAVEARDNGLRMIASIDIGQTGTPEHIVVETSDPRVWVSEAQTARDGDTLTAMVDMVHPSGAPFALDRSGVRITVLGSEKAVDIQGCSAG